MASQESLEMSVIATADNRKMDVDEKKGQLGNPYLWYFARDEFERLSRTDVLPLVLRVLQVSKT